MNIEWIQLFQNTGDAVVAVLVWPGKAGLAYFIEIAPATSAKLDIVAESAATNTIVVLSIAFWVLGATAIWFTYRLIRNLVRISVATYSTFMFRSSELLYGIKTGLTCRLKKLRRHSVAAADQYTGELEIDDLDMAVLNCATAAGPGYAISAPELAEKLTLRPAQVQKSLDKLTKNKILSSVIGSTDGFSNYRLSDYGTQFSTMLTARGPAAA